MLYAGLDIHKNFSQAVVCRENGNVLKEGRVPTTKESISEFFSEFKEELKIAIEAGINSEYIFDFLEEQGHKVTLAHPLKTRMIAESRVKTDKIDANILAYLLRTNLLPTSYMPPKDIREIRQLVRQRIFLGRFSAKLKNRIHAELIRKGIRYERKGIIFTSDGKNWLHSLNMPFMESYLIMLGSIEDQIKKHNKKINQGGRKYEEVKLLTSIPGIGVYSALVIFSEIGNIERFNTEEKLFSYSGLIPSVNQSGNHRYYGRITKQGSKNLRWILTENVRVHLNWARANDVETKLLKYYLRLCKKGKPKNKAVIATARKLLQVIYWMLKNKTGYCVKG